MPSQFKKIIKQFCNCIFAITIFCALTHCSPAPQKVAMSFPLETYKAETFQNETFQNKSSAVSSNLPTTTLPALQQQWWVTYRNQSYPLQVYIEPNLPHWKMVMTNNLGQRILTVDSQNKSPVLGDSQHPLHAIYADLINAAHWSFWPRDYLLTKERALLVEKQGLLADKQDLLVDKHRLLPDARWDIREQGARREIYFSGILQATFEAPHYKAYTQKGQLNFEIAIQSGSAE